MSKKSSVPPEHDRQTRARIRSKLLLYKEAHDLGAPELTARIHDAEKKVRKVTLGVSTVQRFLAGKGRTRESYVDMFERFTKDFPSSESARQTLTSYMEENGIGVRTLAERFTDVDPEYEIDPRILHRFVRGHARPNDHYLTLFHRLAESLT